MIKAIKHIYYDQVHSWGEIFYSVYNEPLDGDSLFTSEKWKLGNKLEALNIYLVVKIKLKEQNYVFSECVIIEEERGKEVMRLSNLFKSFWKRLG